MIKVICIEIPENNNRFNVKKLEIGKIYEAEQSPYALDCWITNIPAFSYDPATNLSYSFEIGTSHDKKYFITLAEWRQQQIDKILEDD